MIFNSHQYQELHSLMFRPDYPGYKPEVVDSPNGDGVRDSGKRYAHVSQKYLTAPTRGDMNWGTLRVLMDYLDLAYQRASSIAVQLGVPREFMPSFEHGCLRVLEYPADTGSAWHTDFDLFTVNCYRDVHNWGLGDKPMEVHMGEIGELIGLGAAFPHKVVPDGAAQHSIVYFAEPSHDAVLPDLFEGKPDTLSEIG
jgi:isopenicillin N synthase-like dioxygenase